MKSEKKDPQAVVLAERQDKLIKLHQEASEILDEEYDFEEQKMLARVDWQESKVLTKAAVFKTLSLGKRLAIMKEIEGHGKFTDVCEFVGIHQSRAEEAIRLYRKMGDAPALAALADAGTSKLLELLRLPDDMQDEVKATGLLGGDELAKKSVREIRDLARKLKDRNIKLEADLLRGQSQLSDAEREISALKARRSSATDEEAAELIRRHLDGWGGIEQDLLLLPVDKLDDKTLTDLVIFSEYVRARCTILDNLLDERTGILGRVGKNLIDADLVDAELKTRMGVRHFHPAPAAPDATEEPEA